MIQFIVELLLKLKREIQAMATRFTNLEFYATTTDGKRRPVATNIDETPTDIENPDPGGDGGGSQNPGGDQGGGDQGTGGDIGNPSGSVSTTLGDAPTLSRKTHAQDIFVQQGSQFSITYVASGPCTILPKKGFNDMDVTYSDDGLEMTLSYTPPPTMPGDSYYIGAEAHVYGGDDVEAISDIYDIVHVGKTSGDLISIGVGTSHPVIQDALESSSTGIQSGSTVIIEPGLYNNARDYISIGGGPATALTCPNGNVGGIVTKIVYGPDATTPFDDGAGGDLTESFRRTAKYTTIMAREPYTSIVDRNNQLTSDVRMIGNAREGSSYGFHEVYGIAVKGLAFRNSTYGCSMYRVDSCKITDCSFINSITAGQYSAANGGAHAWFADGGIVNSTSTRNCTVESVTAIYNTRAGLNTGTGGFYNPSQHLRATQYCIFKNMMLTHGCYQPYDQTISQTFLGYGARYVDILNCWAIDSSFFQGGIRTSEYDGGTISPNDHFSFQITNGAAEQFKVNRFLALKDTRGGIKLDQNNTDAGRTTFNECVFWDKVAGISQNGMMDIRSYGQIDNSTFGKVEDAPGYIISSELRMHTNGILLLNPEWDYNYSSNPTLFLQPFNLGTPDDNYCLVSGISSNAKIETLTNSLTISRQNTKSSGAQYIGRIDPGSTIGQFGAGCTNIFAAEGRTGYEHVDNDSSVYDGRNGNKYVNPYSRECWRQWRTERQTYNTTIDGTTYTGSVGVSVDGVIPTDYITRQGTSPDHPINAPFIDDIYGFVVGSTAYIKWRPVCAAFRSTITGYNFYIDGILVGSNQAKESTGAQFDSVASGVRLFNVEVIDPVHGNSGMSRTVYLTIP